MAEAGIYSVKGDVIPIQIIVTQKLSDRENLWLKSLTNHLKGTEDARRLVEDYLKNTENNLYHAVMDTIMRANEKTFEEVNGMSDIVMKIVQEKFDRKLKEETEKAVKKAVKKAEKKAAMERISLIWKKCVKNKPLSVIAEELETDTGDIFPIYNTITQNPGKTVEEIYELTVGKGDAY